MGGPNGIPRTYDEAVNTLVRSHAEVVGQELEVYSFPDPGREVVRLVEVSGVFPATGAPIAFPLGRSSDFPFRSAVVLLTPEEWTRVQAGSLALPDGWELNSGRRVWP